FERPQGQERTTNDLSQPVTGEKVRFTNVEQEWPIGEFSAYYVHPGEEPAGIAVLRYSFTSKAALDNPAITPLVSFINGRFPADERATMIAMPGASTGGGRTSIGHGNERSDATAAKQSLPIVHLLVPADYRALQSDERHGASYSWENMHAGLDGTAVDLTALNLKPTHGEYIPVNIQTKDPIWPM